MKLVICDLCDMTIAEHTNERHVDSARCLAGQRAITLAHKGLKPVELRWQAKSDHVAKALRLFGHVVVVEATRARHLGTPQGAPRMTGRFGPGNEAWTTEEGVALALLIEHAAKLLSTSYPEAARRLHERPELVGAFGGARLLGSDDEVLLQLLRPIDFVVGSDKKRRPRKPWQSAIR